MKMIWTSFQKHKLIFLFLFIIFLFGSVTGFLFYLKQDITVKETILHSLDNLFSTNVFSFKNIFFHLLILMAIIALSFCFMAVPIMLFYLFFEGISVGFLIPIFFSLYKINGLLYFLLYFVLIKLVFLLLLFFVFLKLFSLMKSYIEGIRKRNYAFMEEMKYVFILVFFVILNDLVVYFGSNPLLSLLLG